MNLSSKDSKSRLKNKLFSGRMFLNDAQRAYKKPIQGNLLFKVAFFNLIMMCYKASWAYPQDGLPCWLEADKNNRMDKWHRISG